MSAIPMSTRAASTRIRARLEALRERARLIAFSMDFSFLLRQERNLLSIGYRVEERQLDESCYDLLASEARLASLFAIAKGDIPTNHWFRLGRPIVEIGFSGALMSWSGSMFEYLMPPLVMKEPHGGILSQTSHLVIKRQMQYARSKHIPWGISEAAYNARDREMTYQYTNFGVPGLGLKRGLARNTVLAPYATVLAAQFKPREAVANLERLRSIGALGHYGFYDAVDFTPERVPEGTDHAVVYNYMAHHQGMSVVAIANVIFEGRMRDRFHSDQVIEAAELLLQEKAPRDILISTVRTEAAERGAVDVAGASRYAADPQPGAGPQGHQRDVERPVFGDGDGDRHRLQPLRRHLRHPLARRSDRGSDGHLPVPARYRERRLVVGDGQPKSARGRNGADAFQRRQGKLRQDRRRDPLRGRMHRRIRRAMARAGASPSGTTATPTATSR